MTTAFPIPIEPHYDPASPYAGNAAMNWIRAHETGTYIGQDGTVSANGASPEGQWVDAPDGPPINGTFPQKWVPANPADPKNVIYTVATLYGRGGIDKWVLSPEAETALAEARATIVAVPADVLGPVAAPAPIPPPPAPPPGALAWLEAMLAHFRATYL
ncbi:MAG: hypothetical protein KGL35_04535 [Bradyrhizobium sp.]|nr:hypothetical protein [Bradyrhizobium sp.]